VTPCHERWNSVLVFSNFVEFTQTFESTGQECNLSTSCRKPKNYVRKALVINYVRRFKHRPSLVLVFIHTQLALDHVIKTEVANILFYSNGSLHSAPVDLAMAGTIWLAIKKGCVKKRSSFVLRGGCNPHFGLLALPNSGTIFLGTTSSTVTTFTNAVVGCCLSSLTLLLDIF
jgi:hypothetical protein